MSQEEIKEVECKPRECNFDNLKEIMFEELNLLRANKISVSRARVTSQLCKRIIEAATLELYNQNLLGARTPETVKRLTDPNYAG